MEITLTVQINNIGMFYKVKEIGESFDCRRKGCIYVTENFERTPGKKGDLKSSKENTMNKRNTIVQNVTRINVSINVYNFKRSAE